ncbi:MAG: hypothetical protein NTZ24_15770 [Deltaproteobacteria bacterium]|nr:hypothetical protein [Deltaproteobacteria bacterium]
MSALAMTGSTSRKPRRANVKKGHNVKNIFIAGKLRRHERETSPWKSFFQALNDQTDIG